MLKNIVRQGKIEKIKPSKKVLHVEKREMMNADVSLSFHFTSKKIHGGSMVIKNLRSRLKELNEELAGRTPLAIKFSFRSLGEKKGSTATIWLQKKKEDTAKLSVLNRSMLELLLFQLLYLRMKQDLASSTSLLLMGGKFYNKEYSAKQSISLLTMFSLSLPSDKQKIATNADGLMSYFISKLKEITAVPKTGTQAIESFISQLIKNNQQINSLLLSPTLNLLSMLEYRRQELATEDDKKTK